MQRWKKRGGRPRKRWNKGWFNYRGCSRFKKRFRFSKSKSTRDKMNRKSQKWFKSSRGSRIKESNKIFRISKNKRRQNNKLKRRKYERKRGGKPSGNK